MSDEFQYLFTPLKIGPVTVRNRIMTTAHANQLADPNPVWGKPGFYGERYARYLAERAKGGFGLITFGQTAVHPTTSYELLNTAIAYDEGAVPGFKLATDMIHEQGGKVFIQLFHSGANNTGSMSHLPVWAPSNVPGPGLLGREVPKPMEKADIEELKDHYARSARNSKAGGFDGIEIHSTHGYLLQQFLSPITNKRTDQYGGSLENRLRLLVEVLERVREEIGNDMALGVRIPGDELLPGGLTSDDMAEVARRLEATGLVDFLNVSAATLLSMHFVVPPMYMAHGFIAPLAANIKEAVDKIPIFTVGRNVDPLEAERILADGQADMVAMTRASIADPDLPNKAKEGRLDEIRNCVGCCQICVGVGFTGGSLGCTQNPAVGKEKEWGNGTLQPAEVKKKVLIVGGGPGGMEAAWVAAARGHEVVLYEKENELGGQINLAYKLPGRDEMDGLVRWRKNQLQKYGVKVILNTEVTTAIIEQEKPDALVLATGSTPLHNGLNGFTGFEVPGWNQANVVTAEDILAGKVIAGNKVVILDEEVHVKAAGLAEILASQGKEVHLLTRGLYVGMGIDASTLTAVMPRLKENGVDVRTLTFIKEISGRTVVTLGLLSFQEEKIEDVETVVLITGALPNDDLYTSMKERVPEFYRIGDCLSPRKADAAIFDGHKIGRLL